MAKFWNMASSFSESDVLNMYVYGNIVSERSWWYGSPDDVVTREFLKDLSNYPNARRINVYINSNGGEVFAAIAIAQQLKNHPAEVHTYIDSLSASAATLIAMAGDVRHMTTSGLFMIHLPSMSLQGNRMDIDKGREIIQKVEDIIRMTYQQKCNLDDTTLTQMLEHETWLDAYEAKKYGFIDIIEDPKPEEALEQAIYDVQADVFNMGGMQFKISACADPEALKAKLDTLNNRKGIQPPPVNNKEKGGPINMTLQQILDMLPKDQRDVVQNAINAAQQEIPTDTATQLTASVEANAGLTAQVETLTTQLASAQNEIAQLKNTNEDKDTQFLNSLPAEARDAIVAARKAAADAQAALDKANEVSAFTAFKESLAPLNNLPLQDEHFKALFNIKKSCAQDYEALAGVFNVANEAMQGNFSQLGADGDASKGVTALDEIETKIKAMQKDNPALDYSTAFTNVIANDPGLYNRYREEM